MKRVAGVLAASALALGGLAATSPMAHADERTCRGTIKAVTVDNLKVPAGASCTLKGTKVKGNITVNKNAKLSAHKVRVEGNVQSQGHKSVWFHDSRVDGSIQLKSGGQIDVQNNKVKGDIQLFSNTKSGKKVVARNTVDGNLQCKSNKPAPTGKSNKVKGNKEDQCRRL